MDHKVFEGTYQEFLDKEGWEEEGIEKTTVKAKPTTISKKEIRQKTSAVIAEKSKAIKPIKNKITVIEDTIEKNDTTIATINEALLTASENQDGQKIQRLSKQLSEVEYETELLFEKLEEHFNEMETLEKQFNERLNEI
jgi:ATP-binding cassette subfamily F protein 3